MFNVPLIETIDNTNNLLLVFNVNYVWLDISTVGGLWTRHVCGVLLQSRKTFVKLCASLLCCPRIIVLS